MGEYRRAICVVGFVLAAGLTSVFADPVGPSITNFQPVMMGGTYYESNPYVPPPYNLDPNVPTSPFAGIGSLGVIGSFKCTAIAISPNHILTAGHALDPDNDGTINYSAADVTFHLNYTGNQSHILTASQLVMHPDYTGFSNPAINDDLAIITLSSPLPAGVPIYEIYQAPITQGETFTTVGYGWTGYGSVGYGWSGGFIEKRWGQNNADLGFLDDEGSGARELFGFDFDGPDGKSYLDGGTNYFGGTTLGDEIETQYGPGDSGGPCFILDDGAYKLMGINTFVGSFVGVDTPAPPRFGSAGGGVLMFPYLGWISSETGIVLYPVPVPGAAVLGMIGMSVIGLLRRRLS